MLLETKNINDEAIEVANDLAKSMDLTIEEALVFMVHSAARCYKGAQRANHEDSPHECIKAED